MTLPQISIAFNNRFLFFVHTACQPRVCSDSTLCNFVLRMKPKGQPLPTTQLVSWQQERSNGRSTRWHESFHTEVTHTVLLTIQEAKQANMAKPGGPEVGGTVLAGRDLVRRATSIVL